MNAMTADTFVRMLEEYRELVDRKGKLRAYLDQILKPVPSKAEQDDLCEQFRAMRDYSEVLLRRIQRHAGQFALDGRIVVVDTWAEQGSGA